MAADRAQHVATEIEPALARGDWVVCDRYVPSSLVYQGVVRGLGVEQVAALSDVATAGPHARCRARVRRGRRRSRPRVRVPSPTGSNAKATTFHTAVRRAYRDLAPQYGWVVVDGERDRRRGGRARPRRGRATAGRMTSTVASERWAQVVGQDRAVAQLQRAAERPVHAYLLVGPRGSGIEEAARCFAAAVIGAGRQRPLLGPRAARRAPRRGRDRPAGDPDPGGGRAD